MDARGWLIDLYETVLRVDLRPVGVELAAVAGIPLETLGAVIRPFGHALTVGSVTWSEVFSSALTESGREPSRALVDELVEAGERLLVDHVEMFDDGVDLLARLRAAGVRTALVSNCAPNTRALLAELGLDRSVDHVVLSCEVGAAKPDPAIFRIALDRLDVTPDDAVLVDDQPSFCAGAVDLGMRAVQVDREIGEAPAADWARCRDLTQLRVEVGSG